MNRQILLSIILFVFLISLQLSATTIHVPAQQPTIQDALDSLQNSGDTIMVAPGTYIENLSTSYKSVVLLSQSGPDVTSLLPVNNRVPTIQINPSTKLTIVQGFTFEHSAFSGGAISVCDNADISNNIFHNNQMGIAVYCYNPNIHNNLFIKNTYLGGIVLFSAAQIYNNTFDSNERGINFVDSEVQGTNIKNNIFYDEPAYIYNFIYYPDVEIDYNNYWYSRGGYVTFFGANDISVDPLFIDLTASNYNLHHKSPCIDAGNPSEFDADGTRVDMGAFPRLFEMPRVKQFNYGETSAQTITTLRPGFFWVYFDINPTAQAQYHIQVGTDDDWSTAELWDSGPVASSVSESIYDGLPLTDYTKYYLRIRLSDGTNWGGWIPDWFIVHTALRTFKIPQDKPMIQEGIDYSLDGDTILVGPGIYFANINFDGKALVIISEKGPTKTFVRPSDEYIPTVIIDNGEGLGTVLSGFMIRNGSDNVSTVMIGHNSEAVIEYNIFKDNISEVINPLAVIKVENRAIIRYNQFFDNGGISCIWSDGETEIINNTMDSNERGVYSSNLSTILRNNIITNSVEYATYGYFDYYDYNNIWNNGSSMDPGPNGISADPLYVDDVLNDFNIRLASPCVDAGDPDPIYNDLNGTRNDIGALPFYYCGDIDLNNEVSVSDIIFLINYYFAGGPPPTIFFKSDLNCDDIISLVDIIYLNRHILSYGSVQCCYY